MDRPAGLTPALSAAAAGAYFMAACRQPLARPAHRGLNGVRPAAGYRGRITTHRRSEGRSRARSRSSCSSSRLPPSSSSALSAALPRRPTRRYRGLQPRPPQRPGPAPVAENAEAVDAVPPVGRDVEQNASHDLVGRDGGDAAAGHSLPRPSRPAAPEGDPFAVEGDDAAHRDGDPSVMGRLMSNTDLHDFPAWHALLNMKHHCLRPIVVPGMINMGGCLGRSG